jgi:hypothetical protein
VTGPPVVEIEPEELEPPIVIPFGALTATVPLTLVIFEDTA